MYLGQMVEKAPSDKLFKHPMHPYTQALLSAIPIPDPKVPMNRITMKGEITSPINPEKGCRFCKTLSICYGMPSAGYGSDRTGTGTLFYLPVCREVRFNLSLYIVATGIGMYRSEWKYVL